eukprot:TCALIF_02773-PA protein Name:"Protein of unknown function" AED:0.24 eAED:0.24 QI:158/0.5/0.66/0.66/0.5/0.33/3/0/111
MWFQAALAVALKKASSGTVELGSAGTNGNRRLLKVFRGQRNASEGKEKGNRCWLVVQDLHEELGNFLHTHQRSWRDVGLIHLLNPSILAPPYAEDHPAQMSRMIEEPPIHH